VSAPWQAALTSSLPLALAALALAGCTAAATTPAPPRHSGASLGCAWYTPLAPPGQVVNVTASGPACGDRTLIGWLAGDSDRPWMSEAVIPGSFGTMLATLAKGGTTARVWCTGPLDGQACPLAGRIANAMQAAGWTPQP